MQEKKEKGNLDPENIEKTEVGKIKVNETEYEVKEHELKDGKIIFEEPENLKDEDREKYQEEAKKVSSFLAKANKKGLETNKKLKELEEKEEKLRIKEAELEMKANQKRADIPSIESLMMKHLKITDPNDLDDEDVVSVGDYRKAERRATEERNSIIRKNESTQITTQSLIQNLILEGYDYNEFVTFANQLNAPVSQALINTFKKQKTKQESDFTVLKDVQSRKIDFIKSSGVIHKENADKARADRILKAGNQKTL